MHARLERRGKWWSIIIEQVDARGLRTRTRRSAGRRDKDQAREYARQLVNEMEEERFLEPRKISVAQFLEEWLASKGHLRETTLVGYGIKVRQFCSEFGDLQVRQLTPLMLRAYYNRLAKQVKRVDNYHRVLHAALNDAVAWRIIIRNPADHLKVKPAGVRKIRPLTPEECVRLLDASKGLWLHEVIALTLETGMRREDIGGLKWEDIDFKEGTIFIHRGRTQAGRKVIEGDLKTQASQRLLPLSQATLHLLKQLRLRTLSDYVFPGVKGQPRHPGYFYRAFKAFATRHGIPDATFHGMRHTTATLLLEQGAHPRTVQERLGHADVTTTMRIYSHVTPRAQKEAVDMLERAINEARHQSGINSSYVNKTRR